MEASKQDKRLKVMGEVPVPRALLTLGVPTITVLLEEVLEKMRLL